MALHKGGAGVGVAGRERGKKEASLLRQRNRIESEHECLLIFVCLTGTRVIWEKRNLGGENASNRLPISKSGDICLLLIIDRGGAQYFGWYHYWPGDPVPWTGSRGA